MPLTFQRKNKEIKISPVRVVSQTGEQLGVMPTYQAIQLAQDVGLDLVEVSANVRPPVCKIMDFGKAKYQQQKNAQNSKAKSKKIELKEIQLNPNIAANDLKTKINKMQEVLNDGNKVLIVIRFAGREIAHTEIGFKLIDQIFAHFGNSIKLESKPALEGRFLRTTFSKA